MHKIILVLTLASCVAVPCVAEQADVKAPIAQQDAQPVELGAGVTLPRAVFDELLAREDGLALIERMQQRAEESRTFEGMPHLALIFVSVLLFFWSAMFYYQRKHARLHRTIQHIVEKGLPLPPELLRAAESSEGSGDAIAAISVGRSGAPPVWASNLLWGGLLWITIGIAGTAYLWMRNSDGWPWAIAAIVYGVAAAGTALRQRPSVS